MSDTLLSVVMPVYNRERFLAEAIRSVIEQTYANWEFIIIDDKSCDMSYEIAQKFAEADRRIKVFANTKNMGIAACRNMGVALSKGSCIAFLDSDDVALPFRFAKQLELIESGYEMVGSSILFMDDKSRPLNKMIAATAMHEINKSMRWTLPLFNPTLLAKREVFERTGEYRFPVAEDYDFFLRAWDKGVRIGNLIDVAVHVRLHQDNVSSEKVSMMRNYTALAWKLHCERISAGKEISEIKFNDQKWDLWPLRKGAHFYRIAAISSKLSIRFWFSLLASIVLWPPNLIRIVNKLRHA